MFAVGVSAQTVPHRQKPAFPQIDLPEKARGERAIQLLGARLPEVAAWYGKSPAEFSSILRRDRLAIIDRKGRMLYEEEIEPPTGTAGSPTSTGTLVSLDRTLMLHSKPGAKRTIYLNFVGATLTNTVWNSSASSITALPFDLDGVPYSFSAAELERIQYIWQRVAEDYAAFDVDVTTEPPPADALTRSGSGDDTFGTTVLITKRTFYSCNCGGVAYIGVFDDTSNYYKPALVFYDRPRGGQREVRGRGHLARGRPQHGPASRRYVDDWVLPGPRQRRDGLGPDHGCWLLPVPRPVEQGRVPGREQQGRRLRGDGVQRPAAARRRPRRLDRHGDPLGWHYGRRHDHAQRRRHHRALRRRRHVLVRGRRRHHQPSW